MKYGMKSAVLYIHGKGGSRDELTSYETISAFAEKHHADLTVMENGGHWFHTQEQMRFLDEWIRSYVRGKGYDKDHT